MSNNGVASVEVINKIVELFEENAAKVIEHDGRAYLKTHRSLSPILDPIPDSVHVETLQGLVDLMKAEDILPADVFVHAVSPTVVCLMEKTDHNNWLRRETLAKAVCDDSNVSFDRYCPHEEFVISMMVNFEQTVHTADLLMAIGNVADGTVIERAEDGVTQEVRVKVGVSRKETAPINNPLMLAPYRTFRDLSKQPESAFVFRMRSGAKDDAGPACALFIADGNAWRLEAMLAIKNWFKEHAPELVVVT